MTAPAATVPDRGDWVMIGPTGHGAWYRVEHAPRRCSRCPAGWTHLWCRPWHAGQLGPIRFIIAPLAGLAVRRPIHVGEQPGPRPAGHTGTV